MDTYRSVWSEPDGTALILGIALAVSVLQALAVILLAVPTLQYVLAVPLAVLFGPAAVWGVAIGAVITELAFGGPGVYPLILFVDLLACAVVGRELWMALPNATLRREARAIVGIVPAAFVATLLGMGIAVTLSILLTNLGVTTVLPRLAWQRLALATAFAPAVLSIGYLLTAPVWDSRETPLRRWAATTALVGVVATVWLVATVVVILLRRDATMMPAISDAVAGAVPFPLDAVVAFVLGPLGWLTYLLGAVGALLIVALAVRIGLDRSGMAT